jgi:hypothetical protein
VLARYISPTQLTIAQLYQSSSDLTDAPGPRFRNSPAAGPFHDLDSATASLTMLSRRFSMTIDTWNHCSCRASICSGTWVMIRYQIFSMVSLPACWVYSSLMLLPLPLEYLESPQLMVGS